jgi:hypothetical protein
LALLATAAVVIYSENKNGSSLPHRSLRLLDPRTQEAKMPKLLNLRYAAFGTSRTYGVSLENRTFESYPGILSEGHANNLAMGATGPEFPGWCLHSLVKDEIYDVFILEFHSFLFFSKNPRMNLLVERLRQRFPKSAIIFLRDWIPGLYRHKLTGNSLVKWANMHNFKMHNKTQVYELKEEEWEYGGDLLCDQENELAASVGGFIVELPRPPTMREALDKMADFFLPDLVHYTVKGHQWIANLIEIAMIQHDVKPIQDSEVAEWKFKDRCESWFQPTFKAEITHEYSPNLLMNNFRKHKYALEVPQEGGWIKVKNDIGGPARVIIQFMMTGPDLKYPTATISLPDYGGAKQEITVEPHNPDAAYPYHANWISKVGVVPPGESLLTIRPNKAETWPFRVVGIFLTPDDPNDDIKSPELRLGFFKVDRKEDT